MPFSRQMGATPCGTARISVGVSFATTGSVTNAEIEHVGRTKQIINFQISFTSSNSKLFD